MGDEDSEAQALEKASKILGREYLEYEYVWDLTFCRKDHPTFKIPGDTEGEDGLFEEERRIVRQHAAYLLKTIEAFLPRTATGFWVLFRKACKHVAQGDPGLEEFEDVVKKWASPKRQLAYQRKYQ